MFWVWLLYGLTVVKWLWCCSGYFFAHDVTFVGWVRFFRLSYVWGVGFSWFSCIWF